MQGRRTRGGCGCFNTHTFPGERVQHPHFFLHKRLTAVALRFSGRSVSALAAAASSPYGSSPLPLKHDTGFECDRLMIGCSALSPASLGVLDLSVSSCWGGGNLWLWLFTSPFSRYFEWVYFHNRVLTYFLCVPSVFLYFSSIIHLNGKLFISCMLYLLYPSVIVFIVFIVNKQTTSIPRTFEKLATPLIGW